MKIISLTWTEDWIFMSIYRTCSFMASGKIIKQEGQSTTNEKNRDKETILKYIRKTYPQKKRD